MFWLGWASAMISSALADLIIDAVRYRRAKRRLRKAYSDKQSVITGDWERDKS